MYWGIWKGVFRKMYIKFSCFSSAASGFVMHLVPADELELWASLRWNPPQTNPPDAYSNVHKKQTNQHTSICIYVDIDLIYYTIRINLAHTHTHTVGLCWGFYMQHGAVPDNRWSPVCASLHTSNLSCKNTTLLRVGGNNIFYRISDRINGQQNSYF